MTSQLQRRSPRSKEQSELVLPDGSCSTSATSDSGSSPHQFPSNLKSIRGGTPRVQRRFRLFQKKYRYREPLCLSLVIFAFVGLYGFLLRHNQKSGPVFELHSKHAPRCRDLEYDQVSYTLVTQFSTDRLWMMQHHCQRWGPHPISVAVLTNERNSYIQRSLVELGCLEEQLSVQTLSDVSLEDYPVNVLRNLALSKVQTSHVAYIDVDFWESVDLHETLMSDHIRLLLKSEVKTALVIPAFQLRRQCAEWRECPEDNVPAMPQTQDDLFAKVRDHQAMPFDPTNRGGHGSTRYSDWMMQSATDLVPITCVLSNRYEPYLVFRYCRDVPPFQEAFSGYGKNKMTWVMQLRHMGWKLLQLGESFVVHYPHLDSKARLDWNGGPEGKQLKKPKGNDIDWLQYKRGRIDQTFVEFRDWLKTTVPDQSLIHFCDDAMDDDVKLWIPRNGETQNGKDEGDDDNDSDDTNDNDGDDDTETNDDGVVSADDDVAGLYEDAEVDEDGVSEDD